MVTQSSPVMKAQERAPYYNPLDHKIQGADAGFWKGGSNLLGLHAKGGGGLALVSILETYTVKSRKGGGDPIYPVDPLLIFYSQTANTHNGIQGNNVGDTHYDNRESVRETDRQRERERERETDRERERENRETERERERENARRTNERTNMTRRLETDTNKRRIPVAEALNSNKTKNQTKPSPTIGGLRNARQTYRQTADRHTGRKAGSQAGIDRQTGRQAETDRQAGRQRQTGSHTGRQRQTDRQAGRQRQTDR